MMEANLHRHRNRHEAFQRRHFLDVWPHVGRQQVRILPRLRIVAIHRRAHRDEVQVVAVIHHRIDALHPGRLDVGTIDFRRLFIGLHGCFIVAGADVHMRRHVHNVSRAGCQRASLFAPASARSGVGEASTA